MGSGEEWANDGSCWLALAGIASAAVITIYGVAVLIADVVKLLG